MRADIVGDKVDRAPQQSHGFVHSTPLDAGAAVEVVRRDMVGFRLDSAPERALGLFCPADRQQRGTPRSMRARQARLQLQGPRRHGQNVVERRWTAKVQVKMAVALRDPGEGAGEIGVDATARTNIRRASS